MNTTQVPGSLKHRKFRRSLKIFNIAIASILLIWVTLGNLIAHQAEQPIIAAKADFLDRFPNTEKNAAARKVDELFVSLQSNYPIEKLDKIRWLVADYINPYFTRPSDAPIEAPPQALQDYLKAKSSTFNDLRQLLLANEAPVWGTSDLLRQLEGDFMSPDNSFEYVTKMKLLFIDTLNHIRLGEDKQALEGVEASWKLIQSLSDRPTLLVQLVSLINSNSLMALMRRLDRVPPGWRQRIVDLDYLKTILTALQLETFGKYELIRNFPNYTFLLLSPSFSSLIQPLRQPYLTLTAVDFWQSMTLTLERLFKQDICQSPPETANFTPSSSDIFDILPLLRRQWFKAAKHAIHWEFTQKILQLKEVATQTGKYPQSLTGLETSSVCQDLRYTYRVSANGDEMNIAIANMPKWLMGDNFPSTYTSKVPRDCLVGR